MERTAALAAPKKRRCHTNLVTGDRLRSNVGGCRRSPVPAIVFRVQLSSTPSGCISGFHWAFAMLRICWPSVA